MKIYTRTGDDGSTGLLGAGRVSKSTPRVEAYGSVDELNAVLGVVVALDEEGWVRDELTLVQARLFQVGAELAAIDEAALAPTARVTEDDIVRLERWIDGIELELAPLKSFILPAGTVLAAHLHLARTVCRRAERRVVTLMREAPQAARAVRYLNRLADLLFMQARRCNVRAGRRETEWHGRGDEAGQSGRARG